MISNIHQLILDSLTSGLIYFNTDGIIQYINPTAKKILHINYDINQKKYTEIFEIYPPLLNLIKNTIETNHTVRRSEISVEHGSITLKIGYSTMQVKDGNDIVGYSIIFQDLNIVGNYEKK